MRVQLQQFATVTATPRTAWTFALLSDGEGTETTVELTLGDRSARVAETLAELLTALAGAGLAGERDVAERLCLARDRLRRDVVLATATSALRSALTQLGAARAGVSLRRYLGTAPVGERRAVRQHQPRAVRHRPRARRLRTCRGAGRARRIPFFQVRSVR